MTRHSTTKNWFFLSYVPVFLNMWLREADTKSSEILECTCTVMVWSVAQTLLDMCTLLCERGKTCDTEIKNACDHCLFRFGCKMVLCLFTFVLQTHIWKDLELHTFIHFSLQLWITSSACINLLRIFSLHKPWAAPSECVGEHYTRRLGTA